MKTVLVGETAHLPCGDAGTVITPVDWWYQPAPDIRSYPIISAGHLTNGDFEGRLNINGSTLIINNVKKDDSGLYTCDEDTYQRRKHVTHLITEGKSIVF